MAAGILKYMRSKAHRLLAGIILITVTGCSTDLSNFSILNRKKATGSSSELTRAELAAQGSGVATSSGHRLTKVTVGGWYARKTESNGTKKLAPGLHGNPQAQQ